MEFLYTFGTIFLIFGVSFALINIRHIFTGNEFRGSCATNNPMIKNSMGECTVCGKKPEEDCQMPEKHDNKGGGKLPEIGSIGA